MIFRKVNLEANIMTRKNKYCYQSHLSERKFREIIRYFSMDLDASKIAELTGISRNSVNKILTAIRIRLVEWCENDSPLACAKGSEPSGYEEESEENMPGTGSKSITVLGILNKDGKIYTKMLPKISRKMLQGIVQGKIMPEDTLKEDGFFPYNSLVDLGCKKLYRLPKTLGEGTVNMPSITSAESFWSNAKLRLSKFRGLRKAPSICI